MAGREDDKGGFDQLMASMGVRPIKGARTLDKARPPRPGRQTTASARTPTPAPPPDPRSAALAAAEEALAALRGSLAERDAEIERISEREATATAEIASLQARLHDVERHRASLHQALHAARADAPELERAPPDLLDVLRERGLRGPDEATAALVALAGSRALERLLPLLMPTDPAELTELLDDRLALVCDAELCQPPPGRAVVQVVAQRCDVCGGSDLRRLASRLVNACLLNGCKRLTVVGGSPRYHRQLRDLLVDPRLRVVLVAGDRRRTARQAQADIDGSDVVLLWGATILDHTVSDLYDSGSARVVRVAHRGLAGMLDRASAALER